MRIFVTHIGVLTTQQAVPAVYNVRNNFVDSSWFMVSFVALGALSALASILMDYKGRNMKPREMARCVDILQVPRLLSFSTVSITFSMGIGIGVGTYLPKYIELREFWGNQIANLFVVGLLS